jgi:aminopeptidase N
MGTNERKYAWMDEGWATMIPFKIQSSIEPSYDPVGGNVRTYLSNAGKETDVPLVIPSYLLKGTAYRMASYNRPAEAYKFLRETIGIEKFDNTLREFMKRWNGKHPSPYDFFFTFNEECGEDLSWFWKPWFFEEAYPDLAIKEVKEKKDKFSILVERKGAIPVPVIINVYDIDGKILSSAGKDLSIWKTGNKEIWVEVEKTGNPVLIKLGNNKTPDVDQKNNNYYVKGSFSD